MRIPLSAPSSIAACQHYYQKELEPLIEEFAVEKSMVRQDQDSSLMDPYLLFVLIPRSSRGKIERELEVSLIYGVPPSLDVIYRATYYDRRGKLHVAEDSSQVLDLSPDVVWEALQNAYDELMLLKQEY